MSRVQAIGAVCFVFSGLALGACAANGPEPQAVVAIETLPAEAREAPGILAGLAPPAEVDVVRIDMTGDDLAGQEVRITCDLERKPGTRIVVGRTCESVGSLPPGVTFHPDDWDLRIKSPGVYEMRQRR